MIKTLSKFNELLQKQKNSIAVIKNESNICAAVSSKFDGTFLRDAIEEAIKEDKDYENVKIVSAQEFDYGYTIDIRTEYESNGVSHEETYSLTHTVLY